MTFKLYDQAISVLDKIDVPDDPFFLFLRAQIEFERKNYIVVSNIIIKMKKHMDSLDDELKKITEYWTASYEPQD